MGEKKVSLEEVKYGIHEHDYSEQAYNPKHHYNVCSLCLTADETSYEEHNYSVSVNKEYTVAVAQEYVMNTNLSMNTGAGIKQHEMQKRVVAVSEKDLVELALEYIKEQGALEMKPSSNWSLIPADLVKVIKDKEIKKLIGLTEEDNIDNVKPVEIFK